jgi:hypothetical protein
MNGVMMRRRGCRQSTADKDHYLKDITATDNQYFELKVCSWPTNENARNICRQNDLFTITSLICFKTEASNARRRQTIEGI